MANMDERYSFYADWYDQQAAMIRRYQLIFYSKDSTVEMFDVKNRRTFLKRTKIDNITLESLYIGATVNVFSRQLSVAEFADEYTRKKLGGRKQATLAMIKPDAVGNLGSILDMISAAGMLVNKAHMTSITREEAEEFYAEHKGKPFFGNLVSFMSSGVIVAMELMGEDVIGGWRQLIGPTDSSAARNSAPYSIRAKFGTDNTQNAVHGSDSPESAERELRFFFAGGSYRGQNTAKLSQCTCCLIKPHAVLSGQAGKIINVIKDAGFEISAFKLMNMERANVEEFLEVYKGVLAEYSSMVAELCSGPCIALEVRGRGENTPVEFREFVGPADPEIARHLRPKTLRAIYGKDKIQNAVHCTDLPEDGLLEVEYFFRILAN